MSKFLIRRNRHPVSIRLCDLVLLAIPGTTVHTWPDPNPEQVYICVQADGRRYSVASLGVSSCGGIPLPEFSDEWFRTSADMIIRGCREPSRD